MKITIEVNLTGKGYVPSISGSNFKRSISTFPFGTMREAIRAAEFAAYSLIDGKSYSVNSMIAGKTNYWSATWIVSN
jgi:hypothetical protein